MKLIDSLVPVRGKAFLTHGEVIAVLAASRLCSPVYWRPHKGQAGEVPAFTDAIEVLAAALPPGLVIVADSGLENLCAADAKNVRFVVPLREAYAQRLGTQWTRTRRMLLRTAENWDRSARQEDQQAAMREDFWS